MTKIAIPLRRVITTEFHDALKALARAKGLDVKHTHHLMRVIRKTKDETQLFVDSREASLARNEGSITPAGFAFPNPANSKAFQREMAEMLKPSVDFELLSLITLPEISADMAAELVEFFEP